MAEIVREVDVKRDWWWPPNWPECEGCRDLLLLLIHGWGVPAEEEEYALSEGWWARQRATIQRARYIDNRRGGRLPQVEELERPLRLWDPRSVWEEVLPGYAVVEFFHDREESNRGGRPRLHRHITPRVVRRTVERVGEALEHLQGLLPEGISEHFTDSFGESWPPHLEDVYELLANRWPRGYRGDGTNLRVAMRIPLGGWRGVDVEGDSWEGEIEGATFRYLDLSYDQLRPILDRA